MKKYCVKTIVLALAAICLTACSEETKKDTDKSSSENTSVSVQQTEVSSSSEAEEAASDSSKQESSTDDSSDTDSREEDNRPSFLLSKETEYYSYGEIANTITYQYEFDDDGNVIRKTIYNGSGEIQDITEYDTNMKVTKFTDYIFTNGQGVIVDDWYINEYDSEGNLIKNTDYDRNGDITSYTTYERNSQGDIEKTTETDTITGSTTVTDYSYEDGRLIKTTYSGDITGGYDYKYELNDSGIVTKKTQYNQNGDKISEFEYIEIDGTSIIKRETFISLGNSLYSWTDYEYDNKGNLIKKTKCVGKSYDDYTVDKQEEYEYDDNDNLIKQTDYYGTDDIIGWTEYEYIELN